jgi:hypothetical protein
MLVRLFFYYYCAYDSFLSADLNSLIDKYIKGDLMVGQFIDTFWRKSFIGDLRRARKVSEDDNQWSLIYNGKVHQFQFVWVQGICIKVGQNNTRDFLDIHFP